MGLPLDTVIVEGDEVKRMKTEWMEESRRENVLYR